jgi:hypothetical protein
VRLGAGGAKVADPVALKGSTIEILPARPEGLKSARIKESVPGDVMLLDGPGEIRTVRFFNRGAASRLVWPHDGDHLLDEVLEPDDKNPATTGPPPNTTTDDVTAPVVEAGETVLKVGVGLAALWVVFQIFRRR